MNIDLLFVYILASHMYLLFFIFAKIIHQGNPLVIWNIISTKMKHLTGFTQYNERFTKSVYYYQERKKRYFLNDIVAVGKKVIPQKDKKKQGEKNVRRFFFYQ